MLTRIAQSFVINSAFVVMVLLLADLTLAKDALAGSRISSSIESSDSYYPYNMVKRAQRMLTDLGYNPGAVVQL